jgi:hypothetical protein
MKELNVEDPIWRLGYSHRLRELHESGTLLRCWDTLGWGKAPARAETSALWTHSLWKSSPHHDLLKEQQAWQAHTQGPRSQSSISMGPHLSGPPDPSSVALLDLCSAGSATPQACQDPALHACQISTPLGPTPQTCQPSAGSPVHWLLPHRPTGPPLCRPSGSPLLQAPVM